MKRDMDLIRKIMLAAESATPGQPDLSPLLAEGHTQSQLSYHASLIHKAGLAEGICDDRALADDDVFCVLTGLTWAGHDFIEAARNPTIWQKAKAKAIETVGGLVTDSLKLALNYYVKQATTQGLGLIGDISQLGG